MKSSKSKIEKQMEKHRRIMNDRSVDGYTQQRHYGIFRGLKIALNIINKQEDEDEEKGK